MREWVRSPHVADGWWSVGRRGTGVARARTHASHTRDRGAYSYCKRAKNAWLMQCITIRGGSSFIGHWSSLYCSQWASYIHWHHLLFDGKKKSHLSLSQNNHHLRNHTSHIHNNKPTKLSLVNKSYLLLLVVQVCGKKLDAADPPRSNVVGGCSSIKAYLSNTSTTSSRCDSDRVQQC